MMLQAWLLWLVPLVGALFVPLVSYFDHRASKWYAVGISGLTAAIGLYQALVYSHPTVETLGGWAIYRGVVAEVQVDGLSVLLSAFVS
ncbi:MAG TPA: hypothetical protein VEC08_04455, partial [Nitrososphaerales archaeon]|nr:hypothetical protein [Nitrososphaerales archaeon]